jgi:hypothetical protein
MLFSGEASARDKASIGFLIVVERGSDLKCLFHFFSVNSNLGSNLAP